MLRYILHEVPMLIWMVCVCVCVCVHIHAGLSGHFYMYLSFASYESHGSD